MEQGLFRKKLGVYSLFQRGGRLASRVGWIQKCGSGILALLLPIVLGACNDADVPAGQRVIAGNAEAGRAIIAEVECGICHTIPGVAGANGIVGPPLEEFGRRQFIAGVLPNQPAVLVRWVREAPSLAPQTGMPNMPLDEQQARDVAAYLYTLR